MTILIQLHIQMVYLHMQPFYDVEVGPLAYAFRGYNLAQDRGSFLITQGKVDLCRESFLRIKKVGTFPHKRLEDSPWSRGKEISTLLGSGPLFVLLP